MDSLKTVFIFLIAVFLLTSCSSTGSSRSGEPPTVEEASYAMEVALSMAMVNAGRDFINYTLRSEDFIPLSYSVLREYPDLVPGLDTLLEIWRIRFSTFLENSYPVISESLLTMASDVQFEDPFSFVYSSSTSGTDYFVALHGDELKKAIMSTLKTADFSILEKARVQYNVWVRTGNYANGTTMQELDKTDLAADMTGLLYNILTGLIARNEDLFRTTPDPFGDPRVRAVFGLE